MAFLRARGPEHYMQPVGLGPTRNAGSFQLEALPFVNEEFIPIDDDSSSSSSSSSSDEDMNMTAAPALEDLLTASPAEDYPVYITEPSDSSESMELWHPPLDLQQQQQSGMTRFTVNPRSSIMGKFDILYRNSCFKDFHPEEFIGAGLFSQVWSLDDDKCPLPDSDCREFVLRTSLLHEQPATRCSQGGQMIDNRSSWLGELERLISAGAIRLNFGDKNWPISPSVIQSGICTDAMVQFCGWSSPRKLDVGFIVMERMDSDLYSYFELLEIKGMRLSCDEMAGILKFTKEMLKAYFKRTGLMIIDMHLGNILVKYRKDTLALTRMVIGDFGMVQSMIDGRITTKDDQGDEIRIAEPWLRLRFRRIHEFNIVHPRLENGFKQWSHLCM